jgi:hypothetical protein
MQEPVPQEGSIEAAQTGNRSEEPLVLFQPLELYMLSAFVQRTDSKGFLLRFTEMGDTPFAAGGGCACLHSVSERSTREGDKDDKGR